MGSSDYKHGYGDKVGEIKVLRKKKSHKEEHFTLGKFLNPHLAHFFSGRITKAPFCYSHPHLINLSLSESKALSSHFPMSVPRKK